MERNPIFARLKLTYYRMAPIRTESVMLQRRLSAIGSVPSKSVGAARRVFSQPPRFPENQRGKIIYLDVRG